MTEKDAYEKFKKAIIGRGDRITRVENAVNPGTPDVSCCLRPGSEFWIENKFAYEPARSSTALFNGSEKKGLHTSQKNWIKEQIQAGGIVYIWIMTDCRIMLFPGTNADGLNEMTVYQIWLDSLWRSELPVPGEAWAELDLLVRYQHRKGEV